MHTELRSFIDLHLRSDLTQLLLKAPRELSFDLRDAVLQIECKRKAETKLPNWFGNENVMYFSKLSMEQCSSEIAAEYKANLTQGNLLIDATGGFGVDSYYFSKRNSQIIYIERNEQLVDVVSKNLVALGCGNINCLATDCLQFIRSFNERADWIYLDPARRDHANKKTVRFEDCEPNVLDLLEDLFRISPNLLVKASPIIDLHYAAESLAPYLSEIHVLAINGECKEVLFLLNSNAAARVKLVCCNIKKNGLETFEYYMDDEGTAEIEYSLPEEYLYEPNASVMKAGLFRGVAAAFGLKKIHKHTHLYTSSQLIPGFPGRAFRCRAMAKPDKKSAQPLLNGKKANVSTRNFPLSPDEIKKKLGLTDGGEDYLFACTLIDDHKVILICEKV